jgi:hypothetical protein
VEKHRGRQPLLQIRRHLRVGQDEFVRIGRLPVPQLFDERFHDGLDELSRFLPACRGSGIRWTLIL